jgi:tetratricopeptide (TPR) repeat protein
MLAGILARQGRDIEFASSICEVADRTGAIADLLSCMEVRRNNGQQAMADSILDRLAIRPDRTVAVEEAVARRRMRLGQTDAAIEGVERTAIIESEVVRVRMIASLLMSSRRWEEAAVRLEALIEASEETPGVSEVMLATCLLNGEEGSDRDERAIELMDAAVEANPKSRGMLRRVAVTVVGSKRISSRGSKYIDKLREVDVDQAEFLDLGFQFQNRKGPEIPEGFIARARSITDRLDVPLAWSLYLDILSAAFQDAARKGDFDAIQRLSEQMDKVSFDYTRSFPGIFGPLNRRVRTLILIGDVENARLVAFESIASIEKTLELRDVILLARIDAILGRYEAVSELLQSFKSDILAAPATYRISAGLLLEVAVNLGNVEEALQIHDRGVQAGIFDENMMDLMRISENVDPEIAIRIARALDSRIRDPRDRFGLVGMLLVTSVRTGDEMVALEIRELLSSLRERSSADELLGFQVACLEVEVLAPSDPIQSFERTAEIIEGLPSEIRSALLRYQQISDAERNAIVAYAFPVAILSNNLVARVADLLMEQGDDAGITAGILEMCGTANGLLSAVLPEDLNVLDSRARYLAATGDTSEALAMIDRVLVDAPITAEYLMTKAEILSLAGDDSKALEAARQARIARRLQSPGDERMAEKIEGLITRLR